MSVKLKDLFYIEYGNQADLNKLEITNSKEGIRFISRSSENLGFQCYVKSVNKLKIYNKGDITVTLGGTYLLSAFVQPNSFYTAQNIKVLRPKVKMGDAQKYFYCYIITQNRFRYISHGREANKTFDDIVVPSLNELPNWVDDAIKKIKKPDNLPVISKKYNKNDRKWDWFNLIEYFEMKAGKYYSTHDYKEGKVPLVTSSNSNNGVSLFTDIKPKFEKCITIGKIGCSTFYQSNKFVASSDVTILKPLFNMNIYHAMFIVTLLNKEGYKWSYGRQIRLNDSEKLKIKFPINDLNQPDWKFMANYIKFLPYSKALED